jgi:hypothetical protein
MPSAARKTPKAKDGPLRAGARLCPVCGYEPLKSYQHCCEDCLVSANWWFWRMGRHLSFRGRTGGWGTQ